MPFPYTDVELQDAIKTDEAIAAMNRGEFEKARALARDVISRAPMPEDYESAYTEGDVVYQRFWDASERDFYQALLAQNEDTPEIRWLHSAYPRACFALGFIAVQEGDMATGTKWLIGSAAYDPTQPYPLIELAVIATHGGGHDVSLDLYDQALASRPVHPPWIRARILRGKGFNLIELDRLDEARAFFRESLQYDPESQLALEEIAYIDRLKAGEQEPLPGTLNITAPGGDVSLPGMTSPGLRELGGKLMELRDEGVITAEELNRAVERLTGEPQRFTSLRLFQANIVIGMFRGVARSVVDGEASTEDFEKLKAEYLEAMCGPEEPVPDSEPN